MANDDRDIIEQIDRLVAEEHALESRHHEGEGLSDDEHRRLRALEVHLDQLWDLLRQRQRASRHGSGPRSRSGA